MCGETISSLPESFNRTPRVGRCRRTDGQRAHCGLRRQSLDADGQPKHPYFAEVEVEMRDLAYADRAKGLHPSLGDLYIKAPPFVHVALCHGLAAVGFGGCVDVGSDGAFIDPARQGRDYQPDRQSIHEDVQRAMQKHGWGQ